MDLMPFIIPSISIIGFFIYAVLTWPQIALKKKQHWYEYTIEQHEFYATCDYIENMIKCAETKWRIIENRTERRKKNLQYFNI